MSFIIEITTKTFEEGTTDEETVKLVEVTEEETGRKVPISLSFLSTKTDQEIQAIVLAKLQERGWT